MNEDENIVPVETAEVQEESVAETPQETESETQPETAASVVETPVSEVQTPAASEASPSETFENASALPDSAVKELLDAIKEELSASNENSNESEENVKETSADSGDLPDGTGAEIAFYEVLETDGEMVIDAYTVATDSNAEYRETVINRLDNILVCAIIMACCAFLILFHTLKKE